MVVRGEVDSEMSCEAALLFESFVAFTALEKFYSCVCQRVALQMTRFHTAVVALITFEWPFSSMVPHHVVLEITRRNTGKLACCASVGLFPRVGPFVHLQIA